MQSSLREIRPLTGVRGIAALLVVCLHFFHESAGGSLSPSILSKGYLAVDLFFMLSGLVMALNYSSSVTVHAGWKAYAEFLYKRLARIYPLYITTTGLVLAISIEQLIVKKVPLGIDIDFKTLLSNFLLIQTWGLEKNSIVGPAWSVSTELAAYVVFPFLVALTISSRTVVASCLAALLAALLFFVSHGQSHDTNATNGFLNVWEGDTLYPVLRCVIGFSFGLLGFRLMKSQRIRNIFAHDWCAIAIFGIICFAWFFMLHDAIIYCCLLALTLVCYGDSRVANWIFGNRLVYFLGLISYSIYLSQLLVWSYVWRLTLFSQQHFGAWATVGSYILPILALIALSTILYFSVEKLGKKIMMQALNRKRHFARDSARAPVISGPVSNAIVPNIGADRQ